MALRTYDQLACAQLGTLVEPLRGVANDIEALEPILEHGGHAGVGERHVVGEPAARSRDRRRRSRTLVEERNFARRRMLQPLACTGEILDRHGVEALTQDGFECVLPARFDTDALPEPPQAIELMLVEPCVHLARSADLLLE